MTQVYISENPDDRQKQVEEELGKIETCCKYCVFANYEGNEQVGCFLNRLDVYEARGVQVDECYDNEKEFYVIRDRICNTCRNKNWAKEDETIEQMVERIYKEVEIKADVFLYVDTTVDSIVDVIESLDSLQDQHIPVEVIVVNNSRNKIKSSSIIHELQKTNLKWNVESITDQDKSKYRALDIAIRKSKKMLYVLLNAGKKLDRWLIHDINEAINHHLDRFIMLETDDEDNGLVVMNKAHKLFHGNLEVPIQQKIREIAQEQGLENLIKKRSELICTTNQNTTQIQPNCLSLQ